MAKRTEWLQFGSGKSYMHRVHWPLQCLIFIVPLLLVYQIGSLLPGFWAPGQQAPVRVVAFVLMLRFFSLFGAAGNWMPLATVVAILLSWHLARRDKWDLEPRLYAGMTLESILWAIPCVVIGLAVWRHMQVPVLGAATQAVTGATGLPWRTNVILSVGAAVYEELLFRLVAITLLNWIFVDVFEFKIENAIPLIILTSALAFAGYHFLGEETLNPAWFFYLTALGVYWAGIFIFRGFGIVVGCHAAYDLIVVTMYAWRGQ